MDRAHAVVGHGDSLAIMERTNNHEPDVPDKFTLFGRYEAKGPEGVTKERVLEHFYKWAMKVEAGPDPNSINVRSSDDVTHIFPSSTSMAIVNRTLKQHWQTKLVEFRRTYPEYEDMSDTGLADALYKKFYSDMPRREFNAKIGLNDEQIMITDESMADWPRRRTALALIFLRPLAVLIIGAQRVRPHRKQLLRRRPSMSEREARP
jgi:hypothetical protein